MGKKVSECCDQWADLQTMALADRMDIDAFKPVLNNCSSLDDYELKIRNDIENNIESCRAEIGTLDPNNTLQLMALAALECIDINKLINVIMSFYAPQLRICKIESRVNNLYKKFVESKQINERETTEPHEGEYAAFDIEMNFDKDDLDVDSSVDYKNKKDAWILRLIYNDASQENISLVKPDENVPEYTMKSDKDKLNVSFKDSTAGDTSLEVPQSVIDHIAKHIANAEENNAAELKDNDRDLAQEIAFDIKKEFPNYDMDVIEGDYGEKNWNIQIVYKDGSQDTFNILKVGRGNYLMKSKDGFIAKFTLDELRDFPAKLAEHIKGHAKASMRK